MLASCCRFLRTAGSCSVVRLTIAMFLIGPSVALGQLPSDIFSANQPLTSTQRSALETHISRGISGLNDPDPRTASEARRRLLEVYRRDTTRTFRAAYNEALTPRLGSLLDEDGIHLRVRLAAIAVLGAVASDQSNARLRDELQAPLPAVRYASAMALGRSLDAIRTNRHAYANDRQAEHEIARLLREALVVEGEPTVILSLIESAHRLPTPALAVETIGRGLGSQLVSASHEVDADRLDAVRVGLERMQRRYIDMIGQTGIADPQRVIVETAALTLLVATRQGAEGAMPAESREAYSQAVWIAENLLNVVARSQETTPPTRVTDAFQAQRFDDAVSLLQSEWLAADGPLYSRRDWGLPAGSIEERLRR